MHRTLIAILLTILTATTAAHGSEKRWLHGVLAGKSGEPVLFVEYPEPYAGLDGEYFWLQAGPGLEKELAAAISKGDSLHVFAEFDADNGGKMSHFGGFLFEATVLKIGGPWSSGHEPEPVTKKCERNLYEVFEIPQAMRPKAKR